MKMYKESHELVRNLKCYAPENTYVYGNPGLCVVMWLCVSDIFDDSV